MTTQELENIFKDVFDMNRDRQRAFIQAKEQYNMTYEEFLELLECDGIVYFSNNIRTQNEIKEYMTIAGSLLEQMEPYQRMYELCVVRIEGLLAREIGKVNIKENGN